MRSPDDGSRDINDGALIFAVFCYFAVNFIAIQMAKARLFGVQAAGYIFLFWIFVAPLIAVFLVFLIHVGSSKGVFSRPILSVFVVAMFLGAFVNIATFMIAVLSWE